MANSHALTVVLGKPEWNSLPVAVSTHCEEPAVPTHGWLSAASTHSTGPKGTIHHTFFVRMWQHTRWNYNTM